MGYMLWIEIIEHYESDYSVVWTYCLYSWEVRAMQTTDTFNRVKIGLIYMGHITNEIFVSVNNIM